LFQAISGDSGLEAVLINGAIVSVHQKAAGAKETAGASALAAAAMDCQRRSVARVEALGNLVRFLLLPGQTHASKGVAPRISNLPLGVLLADKAFHSDGLLRELQVRGATAVILPETNRKDRHSHDRKACKWPHLIENFFARIKIKKRRCIAIGYDKTASSDAAHRNLVATPSCSKVTPRYPQALAPLFHARLSVQTPMTYLCHSWRWPLRICREASK